MYSQLYLQPTIVTPDTVTRCEIRLRIRNEAAQKLPYELEYAGDLDALKPPIIAIVGSRHPTQYGREQASYFARSLAQCGCTVLSGGAIGIDTIVNRVALSHGRSISVIGGGVKNPYPVSNRKLFHMLAHQPGGLLLSQFSSHAQARPWHFPKRNDTIACLSDFVLVVEAAAESGSLITAQRALKHGIPLGAIPGPIGHENSVGTNKLIQKGAFCVLSPYDILEQLAKRYPHILSR